MQKKTECNNPCQMGAGNNVTAKPEFYDPEL